MTEDNITNMVNSQQKRLIDLKTRVEENSRNINEKLSVLLNGFNVANSQVKAVEDELASLIRKISGLNADITNRKASIEQLRSDIQASDSDYLNKKNELSSETAKKQELTAANNELNREKSHLEDELSKNEAQLGEIKGKLNVLKPDFEAKKSQWMEKIEGEKQSKERLLALYNALRHLNTRNYLSGRVPEIQILEVIQDQKTIAMDIIAASTGRPASLIESIAKSLERRKVIKIEGNKISLVKDLKLTEVSQ
ncbi:MAG: hypothetical protein ACFFC7_18215 [Candidatus Hermodarchaeota archaeon]